ncbi:MAG: type IV secretion system DNA-binding domain-containing protein [Candidatus Paceibacterota bacterium]
MDPNQITYFGDTDSRNRKIRFGIKAKDRLKHMYVIGKTGMGKSTLLENMAIQDIQNGEGLAFLDPHGGTAEKLLDYVPENRVKDILYFAPFDIDYPIAFNVMEDIGEEKRHLVLSGLMSAFKKLFGEESFSDRMQYILQNTILALLEYPGATMLGINKMLSDKEYRNKVIANVTDPSVKAYWVKEYAGYTERFAAEAIPAIQNKIGQFTSNPLIRNIIGQGKSSFDFRDIMDNKKIMIINLSKGRVGEGNANLIGSMLITKIYLAAMSRAEKNEKELAVLPNFYLYVDEFQSFANKSFADILSEARKYKLNLTIAHQYIEQMEEEVRDAVFGNVGTTISFRVGAFDADVLEKEFAPVFIAEDLVNLGFAQIYLKLMIDGVSSQPFSATTMPPIARPNITFKEDVIKSSRKLFAKPKLDVEKNIQDWHDEGSKDPKARSREDFFEGENKNFNKPNREHSSYPPKKDYNLNDNYHKKSNNPVVNTVANENNSIDKNKEVFLKAKEELEIKSSPMVKEINTQPVEKISLSSISTNQQNNKRPSLQNINSLREALSQVTKNVNNDKKEDKPISNPDIEQHKDKKVEDLVEKKIGKPNNSDTVQDSTLSMTPSSQKEVPEKVLREILSMDK